MHGACLVGTAYLVRGLLCGRGVDEVRARDVGAVGGVPRTDGAEDGAHGLVAQRLVAAAGADLEVVLAATLARGVRVGRGGRRSSKGWEDKKERGVDFYKMHSPEGM